MLISRPSVRNSDLTSTALAGTGVFTPQSSWTMNSEMFSAGRSRCVYLWLEKSNRKNFTELRILCNEGGRHETKNILVTDLLDYDLETVEEATRCVQSWDRNRSFIGLTLHDQKKKKTWMTVKETTRRIHSWGRNKSPTGLTSWLDEEEEKEDLDES